MKPVVPLWALLAYGTVGAATYLAADRVFRPPAEPAAIATLQDTPPSETSPPPVEEDTTPRPMSAEEEADLLEGVEGFSPDADEAEAIAEGDEAVDEILSELELIYEEADDNFIPTEPVSPDTVIPFPVDI